MKTFKQVFTERLQNWVRILKKLPYFKILLYVLEISFTWPHHLNFRHLFKNLLLCFVSIHLKHSNCKIKLSFS